MHTVCRIAICLLVGSLYFVGTLAGQTAKPLTEEGVAALLDLGLEDDLVISRIKKGGIDFDVSTEMLERWKQAGVSEAVLEALQTAQKDRQPARPTPAKGGPPLTFDQVLDLVKLDLGDDVTLARISRTPPVFVLSAAQEKALTDAGASEKVLAALKGNRPAASQASDITDLAIILDCSGSMKEQTREGESKMAAAKRVVSDLVKKIPLGLNVTFIVYGHEVFGPADDPRNCESVKVVRPLSELDAGGREELVSMISHMKPTGATPIALSLRTAGAELQKNDALCGVILITDGLETCSGDPAAEAASLVAQRKATFGVNVVGFGVDAAADKELKAIADRGNGKYYNADSAAELAESLSKISQDIDRAAKKPETRNTTRRGVRILQPEIEFPPMARIYLLDDSEANLAVKRIISSIDKYGEVLALPSGSKKYAIFWEPEDGFAIPVQREFSIPEREVVDLRLEDHVGLLQVSGSGTVKEIFVVKAGDNRAVKTKIQQAKKYGETMVVPKGKVDVYIDDSLVEEEFEIEAGKLNRL